MGYNLHVKINALIITKCMFVINIAGIEVSPSPSSSLYESSPSLSLQFSSSLFPFLSQLPSSTLEINGELSSKLMYICEYVCKKEIYLTGIRYIKS